MTRICWCWWRWWGKDGEEDADGDDEANEPVLLFWLDAHKRGDWNQILQLLCSSRPRIISHKKEYQNHHWIWQWTQFRASYWDLNLQGLASSWHIPVAWWLVGHPTQQSVHQWLGQDPCEELDHLVDQCSPYFHQGRLCSLHQAKSFVVGGWIRGWGWWGRRRWRWQAARTSSSPSPPTSFSLTVRDSESPLLHSHYLHYSQSTSVPYKIHLIWVHLGHQSTLTTTILQDLLILEPPVSSLIYPQRKHPPVCLIPPCQKSTMCSICSFTFFTVHFHQVAWFLKWFAAIALQNTDRYPKWLGQIFCS